jgi:nucleoside-diphosphate-sugar epimerase
MTEKNVLVIGGSYFVGRVFVEELLKERGCSIYVMNRGSIPMRLKGVSEIRADRRDAGQVKKGLPDLDWHAVVDFCAYAPHDIETVLSVLPEERVGHYLYVSTATVYAKTNDLPITETSPKLDGPQPELGPFADYGYQKRLAEITLEKQCTLRGIPYTSIRPAFIYGKYNYAPRENYFFDLIVRNETVVLPESALALFSFVSVWDVARVLMGCVGNRKVFGGAFNAAGAELISYDRLFEVLVTVTGATPAVRRIGIDEINEERIPLPFPLDEHLIYSGERLGDTLNFSYTPFLEGMRETYRYYLIGRGLRGRGS